MFSTKPANSLIFSGLILLTTAVFGLSAQEISPDDGRARHSNHAAQVRQLNNELLRLHGEMQQISPDHWEALREQAAPVLAQRFAALGELIQRNPTEALKFAFSPELLDDLAAKFPQALSQIERHGTWQGPVERWIFDSADWKSTRELLQMKAGQHTFEVHFAGPEPAGLNTGDVIEVTGVQVGNLLAVSAGEVPNTVTTTASHRNQIESSALAKPSSPTSNFPVAPGALGSQLTLVMLVNFQDNTSQPYTSSQAATAIFTDANAFVLENSYLQTSLTGTVVGWYTLPTTTTALQTSNGCDIQTIQNDANAAATAAGVNVAVYRRLVYLFPKISFCGFAGASDIGGNPSHSYLNGDLATHTVVHEFGHAFGLWHSHFLFCGSTITPSTCTSVEYGDPSDSIGAMSDYAAHFNAFQKERLGWLIDGNSPGITTATTSGTYSIQPFETATSGAKAIKIFQSVDSTTGMNMYFYLEARKGVGLYDSYLTSWNNPACINYTTTCPGYFCANGYYPCCNSQTYAENLTSGVVVHRGTSAQGNTSYLLDMSGTTTNWYSLGTNYALTAGQTFTDPISGVTISTVSADLTGATVVLSNVKAPPSSGTGRKK
jgi:hypothetical protein